MKESEKKSKSSVKKINDKEIKKTENQRVQNEIFGVILTTLSVLLYYTQRYGSNALLYRLLDIFKILFGKAYYFLPFILFFSGILFFINVVNLRGENRKASCFLLMYFELYLTILSILETRLIPRYMSTADFKGNIIVLLQETLNDSLLGGGLAGYIPAHFLVVLFGKAGSLVIMSGIIIASFIFLAERSFVLTFKKALKVVMKVTFLTFKSMKKILLYEKDIPDKNKKTGIKKTVNSKISERKTKEIKAGQQEYVFNDFVKTSDTMNIKLADNESDENSKKLYKAVKPENIRKTAEAADFKKNNEIINTELINEAVGSGDDTNYTKPPLELLKDNNGINSGNNEKEAGKKAEILIETLNNFGIQCKIIQINRGPTVTRYELQPAPGVKVSKITNLSKDIALSLAASDIRIEAPIPGKAAIGIEVPNKEKYNVYLKNMFTSSEFRKKNYSVPFAVGKDIAGKNIIADITEMPHLLIAGATGSGKSVCVNSLLMSIIFNTSPEDVKLILIDPKVVELNIYNGIPHLLIPVVTEAQKASFALNWAVNQMSIRYEIFARHGVRDINSYNISIDKNSGDEKLPKIVIVIDELADLMAVAANEVEESITRLAQLARAAGIHLVIATQRPSVDVITGTIKANIPSRIAFAVSSYIDSRTILDTSGAEKLLGKGDLLYHPMGVSKPIRVQGTYVTDEEIRNVIEFIRKENSTDSHEAMQTVEKQISAVSESKKQEYDEYLKKAAEMVVHEGQASVSYIQRKLKVGYARAARIVDQMEEIGIVGEHQGSKPRDVLINIEELEELNL